MSLPVTCSIPAAGAGCIIFDGPAVRGHGQQRARWDAFALALTTLCKAAPKSVEVRCAKDRIMLSGTDLQRLADRPASWGCENLLHVFRLRETARQRGLDGWFEAQADAGPAGKTIRTVGVVGAGVMGSGIAQWCAAHGLPVVLRDVQRSMLERGREVISALFAEGVKRGKMTEADAAAGLARITTTTGWDGFAECDLVIEAIVESVAAKRQLFSELAAVVRPDALLASNTSALPIEEIAGHVPNPARALGLHFFNPVSRMPLVELVVGAATARGAAQSALAFVKGLEKAPVICRSAPGFLVTRVLFFYLNEACRQWEAGVPIETLDRAMRDWGWPMGPMRLIDEVGVDVTDFIFGEMAHYHPGHFQGTSICRRLLAAGFKGRKNGASAGFHAYNGKIEAVNPAVAGLAGAGLPERAEHVSAPAIAQRLMAVMRAEAQRCLDEGVVQSPDDVDFALLSGAGFPAWRGGLMRGTEMPSGSALM
jgi:3-hydroxyacyl-CoA dehydrogenase/enoyl-CoA hydratase/3-hydroxybutyryl-CoA epimerase